MTVIFESRAKNRYSINHLTGVDEKGIPLDFGQVIFVKGIKATTDKNLIRALLQHTGYRRGDFDLVTNRDLVSSYLNDESPDILTTDVLNNITIEGIKELGKLFGSKSSQPTLIKVEIVGQPITSSVQEILDFYVTTQNKAQVEEVKEYKTVRSKDMNVRKALEHIRESSVEDLAGFLSEDEERKTIITAYKEKVNGD